MVKISEDKRNRIKSNILALLYEKFPQSLYTAEIGKLEARDEEFVKYLLLELSKQGLVVPVNRSPKGNLYIRRTRWRISNKVYEAYKQHQS